MRRLWQHGKWPKWMVHLHSYTIISFILLMLTGLALFQPAVHTVLIPYLPILYDAHITLGLIFAITLLLPLIARFPLGKRIRRLDWLMPLFFGTILVITGILIWLVTVFPTSWRSLAFHWHARLSYVLSAWLIIHAAYKTMSYRPKADGINRVVDPSRRAFLRYLCGGVVGAALLTIVDPVRLIQQLVPRGRGVNASGSPGFAAYYTVVGDYPQASLATYELTIDGMVANPLKLKWADITALPAVTNEADFHCVTGWSVPDVHWTGIHLKTLVAKASPHTNVRYVHYYSFDKVYTECLSLSEALDPTVLLAYSLNGKPLPQAQGFPLRLVVPKMYGYKSIKWVNRIEFSDKPLVGYWEARGYPNEAFIGGQI